MKTVKTIAKIIIALIVLVPILIFSFWVIVAILGFVILLAIIVKLSGGQVNMTIKEK